MFGSVLYLSISYQLTGINLPPDKCYSFRNCASDSRNYTKSCLKVAFYDDFTVVQTKPFKLKSVEGGAQYEIHLFQLDCRLDYHSFHLWRASCFEMRRCFRVNRRSTADGDGSRHRYCHAGAWHGHGDPRSPGAVSGRTQSDAACERQLRTVD